MRAAREADPQQLPDKVQPFGAKFADSRAAALGTRADAGGDAGRATGQAFRRDFAVLARVL